MEGGRQDHPCSPGWLEVEYEPRCPDPGSWNTPFLRPQSSEKPKTGNWASGVYLTLGRLQHQGSGIKWEQLERLDVLKWVSKCQGSPRSYPGDMPAGDTGIL